MKKKPKLPNIVVIAILTTITVAAWIFFSLIRTVTKAPEIVVPEKVLQDLSPALDREAIDEIEQRLFFEEGEVEETIIILTTPTPTATPEAEATPSGELEASPTPEATQSASLI